MIGFRDSKVVVPNHCYGNWFFGCFGSEFNDWGWANILKLPKTVEDKVSTD